MIGAYSDLHSVILQIAVGKIYPERQSKRLLLPHKIIHNYGKYTPC